MTVASSDALAETRAFDAQLGQLRAGRPRIETLPPEVNRRAGRAPFTAFQTAAARTAQQAAHDFPREATT